MFQAGAAVWKIIDMYERGSLGPPCINVSHNGKVHGREAAGGAYEEHNNTGIKRATGFMDARKQAYKCKHGCSGRKKRLERMVACKTMSHVYMCFSIKALAIH